MKPMMACQNCSTFKQKCETALGSSTCFRCKKASIACVPRSMPDPTAVLTTSRKRRKVEVESLPDSEPAVSVQTKLAASSATVATNSQKERLLPSSKRTKHVAEGRRDSLRPSKISAQPQTVPKSKSKSKPCDLCISAPRRKNRFDNVWVECENSTCGSWYHLSCLLTGTLQFSLHFSSGINDKRLPPSFLCPKCEENANEINRTVFDAVEKLKQRPAGSGNEISTVASDPSHSHQQEIIEHQMLQPEVEGLNAIVERAEDSEFGVDPDFHGFNEHEVHSLNRKLHQLIFAYNKEICDAITHFGDVADVRLQHPLKAWGLIDPGMNFEAGQLWYQVDGSLRDLSIIHTPITAALKNILNSPSRMPLDIDPKLGEISFSNVHTAFIAWFVFDVINNVVDLYELPSMKQFRTLMAAVFNFGCSRWPGNGKHVLREIQMRAWAKNAFQKQILEHGAELRKRMDNFLKPLTIQFPQISSYSYNREQLIDYAIKLWSYFCSLGGMMQMIQPRIGSAIDLELHDVYSSEGLQQESGTDSKQGILWVLSRGLRYTERGLDGPRILTIKARVIVQ